MLAMLFLVLFTTLSVAMMSLSVANTQGAANLSEVAPRRTRPNPACAGCSIDS